jgi:hypothetical protein
MMRQLQSQQGLPSTPKPHEVFDLIGGTSTGGLMAILLGRLRLSVDQALKEYGDLGEKLFSKKKGLGHEGAFSATNFERVVRDLVKRHGNAAGDADEDLKFMDDGKGCCKM